MSDGAKRVVMKKPKLDMNKRVDLTPTPQPDKDKPQKKRNGIKKPEPIIETKPEPQEPEEESIEISEEKNDDDQTILKTSSNRTIIATPARVPDRQPKPQTFDDQFLGKLEIKSQTTREINKTPERDEKPIVKVTKPKKPKRRFTIKTILIAAAALVMTVISYILLTSYVNGEFNESLASFIFVVSIIILTIMLYTVLLIDFLVKDKVKK